MNSKTSALCYLTRTPDSETIEFAEELARDSRLTSNVDIYIMVDDNNFNVSAINDSSNVRLLQISREKCLQHNYHKAINSGGIAYRNNP